MKWKIFAVMAFMLIGIIGFFTASCSNSPTAPNPTPTPTPTATGTPTNTPTPTPIRYEDWDRANYPAFGDPWGVLTNVCPAAIGASGYMADPYFNAGMSATAICIDTTTTHSSSPYALKVTGTYDASGTGLMELAMRSGYANGASGNYGFPINVKSTAPSSLTFWLYSNHALVIRPFIQDAVNITTAATNTTVFYGSTTNVTTTGSWVQYTFAAAGWPAGYATLNWTSIFHTGLDISPDAASSFTATVYLDEVYYNP